MVNASDGLTVGTLATAGVDPAALEAVYSIIHAAIADGRTQAAALHIARHGQIVIDRQFGVLRRGGKEPVTRSTVFLAASLTKPMVATGLMLLVEEGLVDLHAPVKTYLPAFRGEGRDAVRVRQLLSHASGLPDQLPDNIALRQQQTPPKEFLQHVFTLPLTFSPGTAVAYQSMGFALLGMIIERVTNHSLPTFLHDRLFGPVGMRDTSLGLGDRPVSVTPVCGLPQWMTDTGTPDDRTVWDWNSAYWRNFGSAWGGIHTTGRDVALFLRLFLDGGLVGDRRIVQSATVTAMTRDCNEGLDRPWGLGWALRDSRQWTYFGDRVSVRTFGHCGATGCVCWADPEKTLTCVFLSTWPCENDGGALLSDVSNAVAAVVLSA